MAFRGPWQDCGQIGVHLAHRSYATIRATKATSQGQDKNVRLYFENVHDLDRQRSLERDAGGFLLQGALKLETFRARTLLSSSWQHY